MTRLSELFWELGFKIRIVYFAVGIMSLTLTGTFYYITHVYDQTVQASITGIELLKPLRESLNQALEIALPYLYLVDVLWLISLAIFTLGSVTIRTRF